MTVAEKLVAWPDALRNGEYKQTEGHLKDETGYCCIGVLDEIVFDPEWKKHDEGDPFFYDEHMQTAMLTPDVASQVGLEEHVTEAEIGAIKEYFKDVEEVDTSDFAVRQKRQITLTMLNDRGATFEQIADVVENLGWHKIEGE